MKKLSIIFIIIAITSVVAREPGMSVFSKKTTKVERKRLSVVATYYNPVEGQCDSDPLVTASNDKIDLTKLKKKKIRWIACSRDLLKRWGGELSYGDTVEVLSNNKNLNGLWIVKDSMNKRYKKRIDFLCSDRIKGSFKSVEICKR